MSRQNLANFLYAWIPAWAIMVFLPGAIAVVLGSPLAEANGRNALSAIWALGDDIFPTAKLACGALLLAFLLASRRLNLRNNAIRALLGAIGGIAVMVIVLALIPVDHARGFGIGLTGERFDSSMTPLYLAAGAIAGAFGAVVLRRPVTK